MAWVIEAKKKVSAWAYGSLTRIGRQMLKFESTKVIRTWKTWDPGVEKTTEEEAQTSVQFSFTTCADS